MSNKKKLPVGAKPSKDGQKFRLQTDSMGPVNVPVDALYGAQTQRAVENFPLSGYLLPNEFLRAVVAIKRAAAEANGELGLLDMSAAKAIVNACDALTDKEYASQFPLDVFQTGSGTSTNMNVNEVIANLAARDASVDLGPNDHVNMSQSSNDVIPSAIHLSALLAVKNTLLPALTHLQQSIEDKAASVAGVVKTGRTHLMDAVPLTLQQELLAWAAQIASSRARIASTQGRLSQLAQGGTAIGSGLNAHPEFARIFAKKLSVHCGAEVQPAENLYAAVSSQDTAVELSGQLKALATALMKIANDLRWMNSGPLAGLGEIALPALQPGSSIMPGKVNPVIAEAVAMIAAKVIGNDSTITIAGQSGNFQLNVMLPVIAYSLLESIRLLGRGSKLLADKAISGFKVKGKTMEEVLARNPILVTALNPVIGYTKAAEIAKVAYQSGRPIIDVAIEMTDLDAEVLQQLLDPARLAAGGILTENNKPS